MAAQYKHGVPRGFPCANCSAPNPSFRCRRCRYREYCSKECQRAGWSAHKDECREVVELRARIDRDTREHLIDDQFHRWVEASTPVLSKHALLALDLANNRNITYLTSINVFVGCEFRSFGNDNRTDVQSFKIVETCALFSDEDMYNVMRTDPRMAPEVEIKQNDRVNNPGTVRIMVGDSRRNNGVVYVPLNGVSAQACRRQSPMVSALRSLTWQTSLSASINAGDVDFRI